MGTTNAFLNGNELKYVDFYGFEWMNIVSKIWPEEWKAFTNLQRFLTNFENLPKLKEYL
jgi:hypothetical protein